jgi:hypothetical protein
MTQVLIDFCVTNKVTFNFPDMFFTMDVNNEVTKHLFLQGTEDLASSFSNSASDHPNCSDVGLTSVVFLISAATGGLIDGHTINIPYKRSESEVSMFWDSLALAGGHVRNVKGNYCSMPL